MIFDFGQGSDNKPFSADESCFAVF